MKRFVKIRIVFVILFMLFEGILAIASESKLSFIQLTTHAESDGAPSWSSINHKIAFQGKPNPDGMIRRNPT